MKGTNVLWLCVATSFIAMITTVTLCRNSKKYGYGETGYDEYLYSEEDIYKKNCGKC